MRYRFGSETPFQSLLWSIVGEFGLAWVTPGNVPQTTKELVMTTATMPERATGRKLGDVRVVAEKLACSTRHVYRMADAGRMPAPLRLASLVRWDLEEIDRWIANGCPSCRKAGGR